MNTWLRASLALIIFINTTSCSQYAQQENIANSLPTAEARLASFGLSSVQKNTSQLAQASQALHEALEQECSSTNSSSAFSIKVREQWKKTMLAYYEMESLALGNLAQNERLLLTQIYFITPNRCQVDQLAAGISSLDLQNMDSFHPSIKGLSSLEYLIFEPTLQATCKEVAVPKIADWNSKALAEKKQDRCELGKVYAQNLVKITQKIEQSWTQDAPSYEENLTAIGYTTSDGDTVKNMAQALFQLEKTKDFKLGNALGLNSLCSSASGMCPEALGHLESGLALEALITPLKAFQKGFHGYGAEDFSFEKYLNEKGYPEVSKKMNAAIEAALQAGLELQNQGAGQKDFTKINTEECKATTSADRREPWCAFYRDVEKVTQIFKTDVLTFLSLSTKTTIPQGDND